MLKSSYKKKSLFYPLTLSIFWEKTGWQWYNQNKTEETPSQKVLDTSLAILNTAHPHNPPNQRLLQTCKPYSSI